MKGKNAKVAAVLCQGNLPLGGLTVCADTGAPNRLLPSVTAIN